MTPKNRSVGNVGNVCWQRVPDRRTISHWKTVVWTRPVPARPMTSSSTPRPRPRPSRPRPPTVDTIYCATLCKCRCYEKREPLYIEERLKFKRNRTLFKNTLWSRKICLAVRVRKSSRPRPQNLALRSHGTVARTSMVVGELSMSHARPSADEWPLMWVNRPMEVRQPGELNLVSFRGR